MKLRRFFVVSLSAITLLLTSCGGSQLEEPLSQEYETFIGEFLSLGGIAVDKSITHLFEDEDGDIYYAYSDRYDLDDEISVRMEVAGLVMEYESLDKPAFNVTRISEAPEETIDAVEVNMMDYTDTNLGFSMTYPDNWDFESNSDSILLTSPLIEVEDEDEEVPESDLIIVAVLDAGLSTTSDDASEDRATEIRNQVSLIYPDLSNLDDQVTMIGTDQQFALRYKSDSGNINYFIPRGTELLELSFYHPSESSSLDNSNIFSEIVSTFRLLPTGEDGEFINEEEEIDEEIEEEEVIEEEIEEEDEEIDEDLPEQPDLESFREFESNPYKFTMLYPKNWYYSGDTQGYGFAGEPIEDDTETLVRMSINSSSTVGVVRTSTEVQITVDVNGQFYTIIGPADYEEVMQKMADSIKPVITEEV